MKKALIILTAFTLTSCVPFWPFNPTSQSTSTTTDPTSETTTVSEPTTGPTTETTTSGPILTSDPTTTNDPTTGPTSSPTSTPTTSNDPTIKPTTSQPNTTGPTIVELKSIELKGSMNKKIYLETESWNLSGLTLLEIYSNGTIIEVGDLEEVRNNKSSNYLITIDPTKPAKGVTDITIDIENTVYNRRSVFYADGIVVNEIQNLNGYYSPDEYDLTSDLPVNYEEYSDNYIYNFQHTPAQGDVNVLVVPVAFKDSTSDTSSLLKDIETVFNGTEEETGWESVTSYFNKASFNNFMPTFTVAPEWYQASITKATAGTMDAMSTADLAEDALTWYKDNYSEENGKEFDKDKDGFVDCVMMIYAEHNYTIKNSRYDNFWAYCFSRQQYDSSSSSPTTNMFIWASYDFMYSSQGSGSSYIDLDAHTYIHEFGHALGLDDYYDYSGQSNPAGGFDMQDNNIGDHNSFSKFALGWEKPYVVYDSSEITLKSSALYENQFIIIPAGGYDKWNGSPFDEYILLEYYTPEGMNEFDVKHPTYSYYTQGPNTRGVRAYHVDARLYKATVKSGNIYFNDYVDSLSNSDSAIIAATNSGIGSGYESDISEARAFDLLHLLSASGTDKFKSNYFISSSDLFTKGDEFSMSTFKNFFPKSGKMNDGSTLGFEFEITALDNESVTIKITKK